MVELYAPQRFSVRAALSRPFRIASDRTGAFTALIVFELALIIGISLVFGPALAGFQDMAGAETASPEALDAEFHAVAAFMALFPVLIAWGVASEAAWYRLMTDRKPWLLPPYRLWVDEGRVFIVYVVIIALMYAGMLVFMFAFMIPFGQFDPAVSSGGVEAGETPEWADLAVILILPLYLGVMIVALRFCVGVPLSVASRELRIFSGWPATRGMVLRLLAAHILVFAAYMITVLGLAVLAAPPVIGWLETTPGDRDATMAIAGIAAYLLIMQIVYIFGRGVSAEAAMVHLTRERKAAA